MAITSKKKSNRIKTQLFGLVLLLPALFFILIDIIIPIMWNIILSFQAWSGMDKARWAGLDNFIRIFTDDVTRTSFFNSFVIAFISALIGVTGGLMLAIMIYRMKKAEGALYRLIFFTPTMIPLTVISLLFVFIYNPDIGLLNNVLGMMGLGVFQHAWLAERGIVLFALSVTGGWRMVGLTMMLCYTVIISIPVSLFEAMKIDGAGYFKQVRMVILPLIKPTLQMCTLLTLIFTFRTYDLVNIMTKGGPGDLSRTVPLRMIDVGFIYSQFGYSASIGTAFTIIVMIIVFIIYRVLRSEIYEY